MIEFPNCKINLGLHITKRRSDGYHNIETVFYPLPLTDTLEFIESTAFHFECIGASMLGDLQQNLVVKAYQSLKNDYPQIPPLSVCLLKNIPTGAGLGGGSADASFMLSMLNDFFALQITNEKLQGYALQLGSDCPFFIVNKPCIAKGRGELLEPIVLDLSAYQFVCIQPPFPISTAWAFANIKPIKPIKSVETIIQQPIHTWQEELVNDFELPVFQQHPQLKDIKNTLYKNGASYASMSGSGSCMFAIFEPSLLATVNLQELFPNCVIHRIPQ